MTTGEKNKLGFGCNRALPESVKTAWGCRAIYHEGRPLDFVWNRQDNFGPDFDAIKEKLNGGALEALSKHVEGQWMSGASNELHTLEHEGLTLAYSPQGSCGYLYIAAWLSEEGAPTDSWEKP